MKAPAIDPVGRAGVAASAALTTNRRLRVLLGALLLALTPGLASARATEPEEWPTTPDRGPRAPAKKIPWMTFSGDPATSGVVMVPAHAAHAQSVIVVRDQELTRRQRRLLRRAERHAEKASRLRAKAGTPSRGTYAAVVVPVVQAAPPAPPRPVVVERVRPKVHVVHLEQKHEGGDCPGRELAELKSLEHMPVAIDVEALSADVERQVERALRDAERARERAERARERAMRDAERAMEREQSRGRR